MSNPVITVTNSIPTPSDPQTVRTTYALKVFSETSFFVYPFNGGSATFDPSTLGNEAYLWYMFEDAANMITVPPNPLCPDFVTAGVWDDTLYTAPSGFVTANNSIMPKIITPSMLLVDNGITMTNELFSSHYLDNADDYKLLFNWDLDTFPSSSTGIVPAEWFDYAQTSPETGKRYVSVKAKNDLSGVQGTDQEIAIHMDSPTYTYAPEPDWEHKVSGVENLVGGGAFVLLLNVIKTAPASSDPTGIKGSDVGAFPWSIEITFGDVTMTLAESSAMNVKIAGDPEGDVETKVNLAEGMTKEGPPQQEQFADKNPIIMGVYPCWNGLMVVSGQQETKEVVASASTFCRKYRAASIQDTTYCGTWFDPANPANVEVGIDAGGAKDVTVDFGTTMTVKARNCRFDIAYLPRFFGAAMCLDGWLLLPDDTADITYTYNIYTIWTKNGTTFELDPAPTMTASGIQGAEADTQYWYVNWSLANNTAPHLLRKAGEIFGYILRTKETRTYSILNDNGSFDLTWTGGTPGATGATDWKKYIKSVSTTIGIDGSSGQVVVDKYGVAGQEAEAIQSIGALVLDATGGENTVAGNIFTGLAMGTSSSDQSGDATWTIPLVGLEKKLDDIALINPPYMDGETLWTAVDYLCRYAGIIPDVSNAPTAATVRLSATQEINSARFDWKSGTSVKTALEDVLQDVNHWYCVRDGKVFIYELGTSAGDYGIPIILGPDRSGGYDSTNMMTRDKTPDFDDLRNYVVGLALQQVPEGTGTEITKVPTFPMLNAKQKTTNPVLPWARCWVRVFPGSLTPVALDDIVERMSYMSSVYEITGSLTIPGNADIRPYDTWGNLVIISVTNNVDLQAKTWTTSMEFMKVGV